MLAQGIVGILISLLLTPAGDARLADAAMEGDRRGVQTLLAQKIDVNSTQGDGSTALHWAAYRDDAAMAQLLLQSGADVNAATRLGITPLFMAARNGNAAMIDLLLKGGAGVNSVNTSKTTPLMLAAASGNVAAVQLLLDRGADVNATDVPNAQNALMFASSLNRVAVVKLLVEREAQVNAVSAVLEPRSRDYRSRNEIRTDRREALGPWLGGLTALHFAAREGHMDVVRELVNAGADVNLVAKADKSSALITAIINGRFDIAAFLLERGTNPKLTTDGGLTALFAVIDQQWAARTWYPAETLTEEKTTHLDLIQTLLTKGADPNVKMGPKLWYRQFHGDWVDPDGATPFWRAAQANDVAAMKLLIAAGADPNIPTLHGCSPLMVAAGFGYEPQVSNFAPGARMDAVKYIVELGVNVNTKDDKGYTPLHAVALFGDTEIIKYMVSKGANPKARANMIQGRADDSNRDVDAGTGDTVADFANGPRERNQVWPEAVTLLREMGSEFRNDCKASTCVLNALPDKAVDEKK